VANLETILVVEDSPAATLVLRLALKRARLAPVVMEVSDGREAIRYLNGDGHYGDRERFPVPNLLLLDLKLPVASGYEVLGWVRQNPEWQALPVIVLTNSSEKRELEKARTLGANSVLTKNTDLDEFVGEVSRLAKAWLPETAAACG
jgi:CheY-like chemotaxis protein